MAAADPYVLVEDEIRSGLENIESRLYDDKLENLVRENTATGTLKSLQNSLESAEMQITELHKAVRASFASPEKFNLTQRQVETRKKQIDAFRVTTAKFHDRINDLFEAERLSKRAQQASNKNTPARSGPSIVSSYMNDEASSAYDHQMLLMKQQDEDLDSLGMAAQRVGQMGLQIGEEIELQTNVIGELEDDVDTTKARLTAARNMINKVSLSLLPRPHASEQNQTQCSLSLFLFAAPLSLSFCAFAAAPHERHSSSVLPMIGLFYV